MHMPGATTSFLVCALVPLTPWEQRHAASAAQTVRINLANNDFFGTLYSCEPPCSPPSQGCGGATASAGGSAGGSCSSCICQPCSALPRARGSLRMRPIAPRTVSVACLQRNHADH